MGSIIDDEVWEKIHRLTFSKSLAYWLSKEAMEKWGIKMDVEHLDFKLGRKLAVDELSDSRAYAIVSESKGMVLRASLFKG